MCAMGEDCVTSTKSVYVEIIGSVAGIDRSDCSRMGPGGCPLLPDYPRQIMDY